LKNLYLIAYLDLKESIRAISLFDPELTVMGPVAFYILDSMKQSTFVLLSILYPVGLGLLFAFGGFKIFQKKDLV
jgi:ABC-2 type transport system permease protein